MTNDYETADDTRESLIWTKEQLLAPLEPTMEDPPHPMRLGASERDYYLLGGAGVASREAGTAEGTPQGTLSEPARDEMAAPAPPRDRPDRPGGPARRRRPGRGPGPAGGAAVSAHLLAASTATATTTSVVFWVLAIVSVAAALGMILSPRAVHCAVLLAVVMLSLAVLYLTAGA